jgi:feruloyl esterase
MKEWRVARPIIWAALVSAGISACGGSGSSAASDTQASTGTPAALPVACVQLAGTAIPASSIGLPTSGGVVTSASVVAASGTGATAVPEYCLVNGIISPVDKTAPNIQFRVAMPTTWNSKMLMFGGGGFDGSIPNVVGNVPNGPTDKPTPLGRGYVTFASDSGHQANTFGSQDGSFALNDEAARNFGGDVIKKPATRSST